MKRPGGWRDQNGTMGSLRAAPKEVDGVNDYVRERWEPKRSIKPGQFQPPPLSWELLDKEPPEGD